MMDENEDPRAPYKVYEGDELKGTYATRAEARRRQQQLESQHSNRHFIIKDRNGLTVRFTPSAPISLIGEPG